MRTMTGADMPSPLPAAAQAPAREVPSRASPFSTAT